MRRHGANHRGSPRGDTRVGVAQFPDTSALNPLIDTYREAWERAGLRVVRHDMYPNRSGGEPALSLSWLWRRRHVVDVLHFHWHQRLYVSSSGRLASALKLARFAAAIAWARALGYRISWTAHNLFPHERPMPRLDHAARRLVTRSAHVVFVDSTAAATAVERAFPWVADRVEVVPQPHLLAAYPTPPPMPEARRALALPADAFVFLHFGLIRRYKGVEKLVHVFRAELASPRCYLVVAGEPHTAAVARSLEDVRGSCRWIRYDFRFVPPADVSLWFGAANVAVFPFEEIFTSTTAILARAFGRAIVVPRKGALPLGAGRGVFSYDDGAPDGLLQAMRASMQSDWQADGAEAQRLVRDRDPDLVGGAMADVFASLSSRAPADRTSGGESS